MSGHLVYLVYLAGCSKGRPARPQPMEAPGDVAFFNLPSQLPRQLVSQVDYLEDDFDARTKLGKSASQGKEAVLADSGRAGETAAGVGRVKKPAFSASCQAGRKKKAIASIR